MREGGGRVGGAYCEAIKQAWFFRMSTLRLSRSYTASLQKVHTRSIQVLTKPPPRAILLTSSGTGVELLEPTAKRSRFTIEPAVLVRLLLCPSFHPVVSAASFMSPWAARYNAQHRASLDQLRGNTDLIAHSARFPPRGTPGLFVIFIVLVAAGQGLG